MAVSYKRLWKLLIDKDMKKGELCREVCISTAPITLFYNTLPAIALFNNTYKKRTWSGIVSNI